MRARAWPSDVLNHHQLVFVARHLPQPSASTGRPAYTNLELLPGICACCAPVVAGATSTNRGIPPA
jgi:hypothetical protein